MKVASVLNFSTYYKGTVTQTMWFVEPLGKLSLALWALLGPASVWWCFPLSPPVLWHVHLPQLVLGETELWPGQANEHSSITSSCTRSGLGQELHTVLQQSRTDFLSPYNKGHFLK